MADQMRPNQIELILQKDVVEQATNDSDINKDGAGADGADDSNTRGNTKHVKGVEDSNTESNTNSDKTATIHQSEDIEVISVKDTVKHGQNDSKPNQDIVDEAINTNRSSTKKNKKRRKKQHKTERDILFNMADQAITYTKYVGVQGTCILLLMLVLIGLYIYGFSLYSGFTCGMIYCPGTMFFFFFGILNTISFLNAVVRWKSMVKGRLKRLTTPDYKSKHFIKRLYYKLYYNNFGLRGRYYLYKLYMSEMLEKISQTYNFIYIYTCTLPNFITILLCVLYIVDSIVLGKTMYTKLFTKRQMFSVEERDRQLLQDVV